MPIRRILLGAIAVIVLLVLGGSALTWRPAIAPISASERPSVDEQTYRRGAELAAIGDCNVCHVGDSGKPYAGGRSIPTPFGTIFASNITPDMGTGIGGWSEAAFQRAMHEGVDREGRQLYPAFPYDHFTKTTNDDIHALYAFLMSQPPVRNAIPANELAFPLNFRPMIAGWKILFFRDALLQKDDSKSEEWNRGRYLVEGLGHCGSCHTPRNILGAEKQSSAYAGGVAEGWDAPPLNIKFVRALRGGRPINWPNIFRRAGIDCTVRRPARWRTSPTTSLKRRRKMSVRWLRILRVFRLNLQSRTMPRRHRRGIKLPAPSPKSSRFTLERAPTVIVTKLRLVPQRQFRFP